MNAGRLELLAIGAAVLGGGWLIYKTVTVGKGLMTGDNALTKGATDSNGRPVTAYQGAGVLGTVGAATNAVSGGYLATFGGWLGRTAYDLTHPDKEIAAPQVSAPYDETERLLRRYPALPSAGAESVFYPDAQTFGNGAGLYGGGFDGTPFTFTFNNK